MATSAPSTPRSQLVSPSPRTDSPGTWRHPRFEEIQRRKTAATFSERHLKRAIWNGFSVIATFVLGEYLHSTLHHLSSAVGFELSYIIPLLRIYFLVNLALAFKPLFIQQDTLADIPLTPSQRALLGLDPSIPSPSTPGNDYITPPKYRLSATSPRSGQTPQSGRSVSTPFSTSPLSGRGPSPSPFRTASRDNSSYSPTASPLLHKVIGSGSGANQDRDNGRRLTYGSPSSPGGLGRSLSLKDSSSSLSLRGPGTPSPTTGRGKGNVNYKWLYERGNAQSTGRRESSVLA